MRCCTLESSCTASVACFTSSRDYQTSLLLEVTIFAIAAGALALHVRRTGLAPVRRSDTPDS